MITSNVHETLALRVHGLLKSYSVNPKLFFASGGKQVLERENPYVDIFMLKYVNLSPCLALHRTENECPNNSKMLNVVWKPTWKERLSNTMR